MKLYFDSWEEVEELNQKLTEIDRAERPEMYEYEGSVWCAPEFDEEQQKWYVLTWI
jgi:hypothetical protein